MFRLNGKHRNGNHPVQWVWRNGRPVTGHFRDNGKFVDERKGSMNVYLSEGGDVVAAFYPAKGVDVEPAIFGVDVTETRTTRFGRCQAYKIEFRFFDTPVELVLPRRHRVLLD